VNEIVRLTVLRRRAHRFPLARALHEPDQGDQDGDGDHDDDQLLPGENDPGDREHLASRQHRRDGGVTGSLPADRDVLEDERHPDRRDQRRESGRATQRPVRDTLDGGVEQAARGHRDEQRADDRRRERARRGVSAEVEDRQDHRGREHPAEHEHVAVREVDQLEDPVHERVAERDERVDGAVREPDEPDREEVGRPLHEVDPEPEEEERNETGRKNRHHVRAGRASQPDRRFGLGVGSHRRSQ
jgi:hypothetical protein